MQDFPDQQGKQLHANFIRYADRYAWGASQKVEVLTEIEQEFGGGRTNGIVNYYKHVSTKTVVLMASSYQASRFFISSIFVMSPSHVHWAAACLSLGPSFYAHLSLHLERLSYILVPDVCLTQAGRRGGLLSFPNFPKTGLIYVAE